MSRSLKRHPLTLAIIKFLSFPPLHRLYHRTTAFLFPLLRRSLAVSLRFMDSLLFATPNDNDDDVFVYPFDQSSRTTPFSDPGESIFLVPFRWWKEVVNGGGVIDGNSGVESVLYSTTVRLNAEGDGDVGDYDHGEGFGESEILLSMKREEWKTGVIGEEGVPESEGDLALVSEWMFFTALKWHYDREDVGSLLPGEDVTHNLFSLQLRLLYVLDSNLLVIKISRKENEVGGAFFRAYSIFFSKSGLLKIWDFSGETQSFVNDRKLLMDSGQSYVETPLELQVYGFSCAKKSEEKRKEDVMAEQSFADGPSWGSSLWMTGSIDKFTDDPSCGSSVWVNGSVDRFTDGSSLWTDKVNFIRRAAPPLSVGSYCRTGTLGLAGLYNLGNTCFMNSAIQCLGHTTKLVDYFLGNFRKDLNVENPLGMNGKLAVVFGDLLRKLWAPETEKVAPSIFKTTISNFAPQFSGYNQHDSQEFLAFLLDGLHEDLNRVKSKPYIQAKDEDDRPDEVVADEYWANHLSRNDSIIVDLCQGQYRSKLVCPVCKKLSITFDPFMYLSLPLPSTTSRKMTLTVLTTDGTILPHSITITVPKNGKFRDLAVALSTACSLRDDETLLITEIFDHSIIRILEDPDDLIDLIRDSDALVAYRLPKVTDDSRFVEFVHLYKGRKFGIPLVTRISDLPKGSEIHKEFLKLINPLLLHAEELFHDDNDTLTTAVEDEEMEGIGLEEAANSDTETKVFEEAANSDTKTEKEINIQDDFEFYVNWFSTGSKIQMDESVTFSKTYGHIKLFVTWPEKMYLDYDTSIISVLPEVGKGKWMSKLARDSISLYKCVDAFLKEEPLGPDDMWYCPNCKEHRQAIKKLDLWRLPEILVIHLKRFSYSRIFKNKLETFVDFPVDLDLSNYVIHKSNKVCHRYMLYAVSNHYGGMGGGHYTAFAKHGHVDWYEFDDSHVVPVMEEQIKTSAAYVLFYKRMCN